MKEQGHCTPGVCPGTSAHGVTVSLYVHCNHPLLQLKRALPWDAFFEVMRRHWQRAGKNTDGRPGLPWDVALYAALGVMLVKPSTRARWKRMCRRILVARVFIGRQAAPNPQIRDHSNIARAMRPWARAGFRRSQCVAAPGGPRLWLCRCQHPVVRYHGAGVTYWASQRTRSYGGRSAVAAPWRSSKPGRWWESIRPWHRCRRSSGQSKNTTSCQGQTGQAPGVDAFTHRGGAVDRADTRLVQAWLVADQVAHALTTPGPCEVAKRLIPQIVQWIITGVGAKGKILHAGVTQARALVRPKAGKRSSLVCRIF